MDNKIKGVVFDVGGVIVGNRHLASRVYSYAGKVLDKSPAEILAAVDKESARLGTGKETTLAFWQRVCRRLKVACPPPAIALVLFTKNYRRNNPANRQIMLIISRLRKKYPLGIISNTIVEHTRINRSRGIFNGFRAVILSHETGARKPQKRIFQIAAARMEIPRRNLLFIDDNPRYAAAARRAGLQAIVFKSPQRLEKQLALRGVL